MGVRCGLADQSCSYRCIVSYQSQAFTDFSLSLGDVLRSGASLRCALQKQNLLNSQIERPPTPQARPMESFRGSCGSSNCGWARSSDDA